jgi:hypothetical protein
MIMNEEILLNDIFDGSFNEDLNYFDISIEDRNIIAEKFIKHHLYIFQEDISKIRFYFEYFHFKMNVAIQNEHYEEADFYERLIKKLFLLTIDF